MGRHDDWDDDDKQEWRRQKHNFKRAMHDFWGEWRHHYHDMVDEIRVEVGEALEDIRIDLDDLSEDIKIEVDVKTGTKHKRPPTPPQPPRPSQPPQGKRKRQEKAQEWRTFFEDVMGVDPTDHWAFSGRRFSPWHHGDDAFNPFVAAALSKGSGLLALLVLNLLQERPYYANELSDVITELTGGGWSGNPGALYPLMTQLETEGFVDGEWQDPDKRSIRTYTITDSGSHELARLKTILAPKLRDAAGVFNRISEKFNDRDDYIYL